MENMHYCLAIESSCDDTSAAIVSFDKKIISNIISTQIIEHEKFGGVVPDIAARAHLQNIDYVTKEAIKNIDIADISIVAATCGPGLIGGVIIGATFAKTIATILNKPFIPINHIRAHALSVRLFEEVQFPYLLLLVSGGHSEICIVHNYNKFEILGKTLDDSIGDCFDKVAKYMEIKYPGGPNIEKFAKNGNELRFKLPIPLKNTNDCNFSFSGIKTAMKLLYEKQKNCLENNEKEVNLKIQNSNNKTTKDETEKKIKSQNDKEAEKKVKNKIEEKIEYNQIRCDLSASFQYTIAQSFCIKIKKALLLCKDKNVQIKNLVMSGGVSANLYLRQKVQNECKNQNIQLFVPPIEICTDNAAMIAWNAIEIFKCEQKKYENDVFCDMGFKPRPVWGLDSEN